ncbi:MAG: methyltransferase domain-containing protein [Bacteroidetes bacterium]|jgi:SAM-dependent methyltransferase|nr:methyltransferase domain-containing protein [Bacteroidota bacterium]
MDTKFEIQSDQYQFPYHYLVDLEARTFGRNLDWGLDYYTYMRKVLALAKTYLDDNILDVGCGDGFLLYHLAQDPTFAPDTRALGIDVDEKPIKFAQAFSHELPVTFRAQDIATLDELFSLVTCVETFEHIPDDLLPSFIEHLDRVLTPGGRLIVSVPSSVRPVIPKHHRHYDRAMLLGYFPDYEVLEEHYVSARNRLLYQVVSTLLANRRINLNTGLLGRALLALHERYTADVTAEEGAHIVVALGKP